MTAYGFVHSLLASRAAKGLACRFFPAAAGRYYRLGFNLLGAVTFVPVLFLVAWLPDQRLYSISFPWLALTLAGQFLAVLGLAVGLLQTGPLSFLGLKQLFGKQDDTCPDWQFSPQGAGNRLVTGGLYHWVRHPLYSCGLALIWLAPVMSWNILALNLGLTAYIFIGATLEERKLLAQFGEVYADYRRRTPMLVPGLRLGKGDFKTSNQIDGKA